uniref:Carbamoyl-phosphate synthase L chain, ATP binding domain protein n=1 Tax=uncultured bacterium Contig248 TaxID=1393544 RepID=W0FIB6_9BACT|nr:carbamoyl-phosphate synthase L chain, ATP binding domain protein [uncultured bacterium Contig248]
MKRKILLLGGSAQQVVAIEKAKQLGLFTVLCDYLPDNPGQYHADRFYLTSTTDREAVLQVARTEQVDYVIAYASDPAAPTAAYVAEQLGLPTNPLESVEILCSKDRFRAFLRAHGYSTPRAAGFHTVEEAAADIGNYTFPVIVKPADSSGSKGVTVLRSAEGLRKALEFAFSFSRAHRIVVEEFIEKKHPYLIGGDIFVSDGKVILWGLMNCHRDSHVNPLVPVGKSYPPALSEDDLKKTKQTLQGLVTDLGIRFGPMNVELVIDGNGRVFPIDIGPRSGGNMIPDLLGMIFGCDVVEMSVRAAMGQPVSPGSGKGTPFYATHNLHSDRDGRFEGISFSEEIESYIVRKEIYKKPGDEVFFFDNASKALGIIFFRFDSEETMYRMLSEINGHIHIILQS